MFQPIIPLKSSVLQTILPTIWPTRSVTRDEGIEVEVGDKERLLVLLNHEYKTVAVKGIVILLHGLTGSADSTYNLRLTPRLNALGYKVCRVNLRGAGDSFGMSKKTYHAGLSSDLSAIIQCLHSRFPGLTITPIGFSLGGNLMLKYLGECGKKLINLCDRFLAISPPFDLMSSALHLNRDHRLWDRYFVRLMIRDVTRLHREFPDLGALRFPKDCSLLDFDHLYTAPRHGFTSVDHYYREASCGQFLTQIQIPGVVLASKDDPIVSYETIPDHPVNVEVRLSNNGGHCGFIGGGIGRNFFWLDQFIMNWLSSG